MSDIQYGQWIARREDDRLLTGRGQFADDVSLPDALHAVFVRSLHASARIRGVDTSAALATPGTVAVLTGADLDADRVVETPAPARLDQGDGSTVHETPRPWLARERVRFAGEVVAMVLAVDLQTAVHAAEQVLVDYEELPGVTDLFAATQAGAPQLWPDRPGNMAFHWKRGDAAGVQSALDGSHHVTRLRSHVTRVHAAPLEPRSAIAWIGEDGRPVLRLSHQSPHQIRDELAGAFGLPGGGVRVLAGDVGGSFGMKSGLQREEALVCWAARRLGRPVRWTATRSEGFLCDDQARDVFVDAELGLDAQGRFTALRVRYDVNVGAYMSGRSFAPVRNVGGISGVYTTPCVFGEVVGSFTNTQVTAPYRGAGRPDATYAIERVIDVAAFELGMDAAQLRRRNLIPPSAMPYKTSFQFEYDSGDFARNLEVALARARYDSFPQRREASRQAGQLRGIGIAMPIEMAGGVGGDQCNVRVDADGGVVIETGSMSVGQGGETTLVTLVAQRLGMPPGKIRFLQGDTDLVGKGKGNGGSGALIIGGTTVVKSVDDLLAKAQKIAARELEVAAEDLRYADGAFRAAGTDLQLSLADVARLAQEGGQPGLAGFGAFTPGVPTFPNGCHICEVEIDPGTGETKLLSYVCVEDLGRVLNPMLVEGQIHGGVAQGIGQALMEQLRHDEHGQLLTGSFMDYAMPRAVDLPPMESEHPETPTKLNPLGVKGVGEAGTVGALSATMNAVCNALQAAGIRHLDMPATPARVWEALRAAGSGD